MAAERVARPLVFALGIALAPTSALAAEKKVALDWTRAPGAENCVDEAALGRSVDAVLGRVAFVPRAGADAVVHGRVERTEKGWLARFVLSGADGAVLGTRDVDSDERDCRKFDEALALVLALAVDAIGELPTTPLHDPPPTLPPSEPWRAEIGVLAAGSYGLLPGVAGAMGFRASVQPPTFWPIGLDAQFWLPSSAEQGASGAEITAWEVGLSVCAPLVRKFIEPRICGGFQFGQMSAEGFGLPVSTTASAWLANFTLEAAAAFHLGDRFALTPAIGAAIPTIRDRFYYTAGDPTAKRILHQPAPAALLFDLTASVTIP